MKRLAETANGTDQGLKICLVGTYPPRECGIGTFTHDLVRSLTTSHCSVIAITNGANKYRYPDEVIFEIRQEELSDYQLAAEYINSSSIDLVCLQHEFGIFGGADGAWVNELLANLRVPVVTTLHTIMLNPSSGLKEGLVRVAELSDLLIVLNGRAIGMLKDIYGIDEHKIMLIHHGVPDVPFIDPNFYKDKFDVEGRTVVLTFGLLNRNKGIETMLEAMPKILARYPNVVYLVVGATHPEVKRIHGEKYRQSLEACVRELKLEGHVIFHDRYVSLDELCEFIGACDIYVTPYQSREQIASGTLAYAVGMGKAVVSTPYLYAEELLADGRGILTDFADANDLANAVTGLIENEAARHRMRKRAYAYGRQMIWSEVGQRYSAAFERLVTTATPKVLTSAVAARNNFEIPEIKLDHLVLLTDDTGIIQHATYGIPDRRTGYACDDVARGLVVVLKHLRHYHDETSRSLAIGYLSFLQQAQIRDGRFHNFMNYERRFIDTVGSEDTQGRALWGLGTAVAYGPTKAIRTLAREMFEKALAKLKLNHPRSIAYAICGLYEFLGRYDGATLVKKQLEYFANRLIRIYKRSRADNWKWFGHELTYANAKLPQAMLLVSRITGDEECLDIGLESLRFLISQTYRGEMFDFPGNEGWQGRDGKRAIFGQQPIEAGYMAEALITAAEVSQDEHYRNLARRAVEWLLGRNRLNAPLYDESTGACADGLDRRGPSENQGAESVICCLLGLLAIASEEAADIEVVTPGRTLRSTAFSVNQKHLGPIGFTQEKIRNINGKH